ncbi:hypothetical protein K435DRAFT_793043 [Dendrothele bispora CBS 962.96]|uniref:DUF6533 domain-containing protein n=1 Tax=Dendrothele bispora (strain CBS 962.96) TaxID=1314807 RepID=A0A4S8MH59_DENBC|nr:hypothetical protein K435DRAFT_793043 [Dendrothele bispora CBS 962.96]
MSLVYCSTLLVYDYLLSIQEENELIWSSKWTWVKVLYIIQRYMPLGDTVILLSTDPMTTKLNTAQILAPEASFHQQAGKLQPINCILSSNEEHISPIAFFLGLLYQIGIVALTLVPGIHAYKGRKFSLMFKVVYRDGFVVNLIFIGT